jgi:hypothetical protein
VHLDANTIEAMMDATGINVATDAAAMRSGFFTLSANTQAIISANASAALTPGLAGSYAGAYFELFDVPQTGLSNLYDTAGIELGEGYGAEAFSTGMISVSIANTSGSSIEGVLIASADTSLLPVPEPESYAMFLAGLGLMGLVARRRRH